MTIEILKFLAITLAIGTAYAVIGIVIDNFLYRVGIARQMTISVVLIAYFSAFFLVIFVS